MTSFALRVIGTPEPQGSKTGFVNNATKKVVLVEGKGEARQRFKSWRAAIADEARRIQRQSPQGLVTAPVSVEIAFLLPKPPSKPKWKIFPDVRPDLDKLERAVLDGITGIILANDSLVVRLTSSKCYADGEPPGAIVRVTVLDERAEAEARRLARSEASV